MSRFLQALTVVTVVSGGLLSAQQAGTAPPAVPTADQTPAGPAAPPERIA